MNRPGHDGVKFFYGREVEHTPAFGMQTLFVVGLQSEQDILDALAKSTYDTRHIYFGANQSFPNLLYSNAAGWQAWENMIIACLKKGYWCTLDVDLSCVPGLTDGALCEHDRFIAMISVKMPYVRQLGYNAVLKIDDTDFAKSNPGVWCHSLHELQNRSTFTDWSQYTKDSPILPSATVTSDSEGGSPD